MLRCRSRSVDLSKAAAGGGGGGHVNLRQHLKQLLCLPSARSSATVFYTAELISHSSSSAGSVINLRSAGDIAVNSQLATRSRFRKSATSKKWSRARLARCSMQRESAGYMKGSVSTENLSRRPPTVSSFNPASLNKNFYRQSDWSSSSLELDRRPLFDYRRPAALGRSQPQQPRRAGRSPREAPSPRHEAADSDESGYSFDRSPCRLSPLGSKLKLMRRNVHEKLLRLRTRSMDRLSGERTQFYAAEEDYYDDDTDSESSPVHSDICLEKEISRVSLSDLSEPTEPPVGEAVALVDCTPSPYDREALAYKRGDRIEILSMNPGGLWRGRCNGRLGNFKFINVGQVVRYDTPPRMSRLPSCDDSAAFVSENASSTASVLAEIGLQQFTSIFFLNGFETLESFRRLTKEDLNYLGVTDPAHQTSVLRAVKCLARRSLVGPGGKQSGQAGQIAQMPGSSLDNLRGYCKGKRSADSKLGGHMHEEAVESDSSSKTESGFHSNDEQEEGAARQTTKRRKPRRYRHEELAPPCQRVLPKSFLYNSGKIDSLRSQSSTVIRDTFL